MNELFNIGDLMILNETHAAVLTGYNRNKSVNILNAVTIESGSVDECKLHRASARKPTTEERRYYWDKITIFSNPDLEVLPHYDGEDAYLAGSVLVFDEKYICAIANDIPKNGKQSFTALFSRYLRNGHDASKKISGDICMPMRLANRCEIDKFWRTAMIACRKKNRKY